MFKKDFDSYACPGDSIHCELDGFTFRARIEHDIDSHIDDTDCHNVDQKVTGCNDKQQATLLETREAWFNDEWFYCGIIISAEYNGVSIGDHLASLWSIECNYPVEGSNNYLKEVANELLDEAKEAAEKELEALRQKIA